MRSIAGFALSTSALFLGIVAVLIGAPSLFYMATALIATIGACHLQARLSVKALRFERIAPASARVGDLVTVQLTVWSERKIKRPLITVLDNLPAKLSVAQRSASLPIAPAYDVPVQTQYQFRPLKRGLFKWSGVVVEGTDALGLVTKRRIFETEQTEIIVLPSPIPVSVELPVAAGFGISEAQSGQTRGAGLEPRGVRAYAPGDSLRHVHWRSTARTGQLLVKEFEAGTHAAAAFVLQRTAGTDLGLPPMSTLEVMCGHTAYLSEQFLRQGARVEFPGLESVTSHGSASERILEIYHALALIQADRTQAISEDALVAAAQLPQGSALFIMLSVADPNLPGVAAELISKGTQVIAMLYEPPQTGTRRLTRTRQPSAVDQEFVGALRAAGASTLIMPMEVAIGEDSAA